MPMYYPDVESVKNTAIAMQAHKGEKKYHRDRPAYALEEGYIVCIVRLGRATGSRPEAHRNGNDQKKTDGQVNRTHPIP